jgi:tRNA-Thr(GGU) m(6)t(6)A37 methyltransferase TsaA
MSMRWCDGKDHQIVFRPVGVVRCAYTDTSQIPRGLGAEHRAEGVIELAPELAEGLADIEGFSHLVVIWYFDRVGETVLTVTPPSDTRSHGVFATRAPVRPNPIGLTVVELLRRKGHRLHVKGVDMLDGSPVLDIKPYLTSIDPGSLRRGWLDEAQRRAAS